MDSKVIVDELGQTAVMGMDLLQWGALQMIKNPIYFMVLIVLLIVQKNDLELQVGKVFKAKA